MREHCSYRAGERVHVRVCAFYDLFEDFWSKTREESSGGHKAESSWIGRCVKLLLGKASISGVVVGHLGHHSCHGSGFPNFGRGCLTDILLVSTKKSGLNSLLLLLLRIF